MVFGLAALGSTAADAVDAEDDADFGVDTTFEGENLDAEALGWVAGLDDEVGAVLLLMAGDVGVDFPTDAFALARLVERDVEPFVFLASFCAFVVILGFTSGVGCCWIRSPEGEGCLMRD